MALNEEEERILAGLESQFSPREPKNEPQDASFPLRAGAPRRAIFAPRVLGATLMLFLLGLIVLVGGVMGGYTWQGISMGVAGIVLLLVAVTTPVNPLGRYLVRNLPQAPSKRAVKSDKPDFRSRMENYWEQKH